MVRAMSWLLSVWLIALYVVGRGAYGVPQSLVWLTLLAGLIALVGGAIAPMVSLGWQIAGPLLLTTGLFALFAVELALPTAPWLPWATFFGVVPYIVIVVASALWSPHFVRPQRPRPA